MPDQFDFAFGFVSGREDGASERAPDIREEVARAWGLPLGERVEVVFRPSFSVATLIGVLELRLPPDYPWDPRQPLALRLAGCDFTSRDIERWSLR